MTYTDDDAPADPFGDVPMEWLDPDPDVSDSATSTHQKAAADFLHLLWPGNLPEGARLLLWDVPSKESCWFGDKAAMAVAATAKSDDANVYFGCGLAPRDLGRYRRCDAASIIGIPGLWMDIDIKSPEHKNESLPPSIDAAMAFLDAMPLPPTVIVNSGHGLHAWWLFDQPWIFGEGDNAKAAALVQEWQAYAIDLAKEHKWNLDNTSDLARVLRLPGTINRKGDPVPVEIVTVRAMRYSVEQFKAAISTANLTPPASTGDTPKQKSTAVDFDDDTLLRKAMNSRSGDKFVQLWNGQLNGHKSQSEADADLCCRLAWWTGHDAERMDRLFRQSGLMRPKWDEKHSSDGCTYGRMTIDSAIARVQGEYTGHTNGLEGPLRQSASAVETRSNEAIDDPHRLARGLLHKKYPACGTLINWRESWYVHDGAGHVETAEHEIRAALGEHAKNEFDRFNRAQLEQWEVAGGKAKNGKDATKPQAIKVQRGTITNAMDALQSMTLLPGTIESPSWVLGSSGPTNLIALANGLLDLDRFFAGDADCLLKVTPTYFTLSGRDYRFDTGAKCPKWLALIHQALEGDVERIDVMQEWFGLNQVHDTSFHRFLGMEGEGSNSKNAILAGLQACVGARNCSFVPLELFAERFHLAPALGKLSNVASECSESDKTGEAILKQFVSGDPMLFDRKNKSPLQCRPTARLTFSMNNRPRFNDRSSGLWRRLILMPMRNTISQDRVIRGMDDEAYWRDETPGIFVWALQGLKRLREQGRFTVSKVCEEAVAEYRLESNPARQFLDERCTADPDAVTSSATLYDSYQRWAKTNGYSPLSNGKFGAEVKRAFPRMRKSKDNKIWSYFGVNFEQFGE